MIIVIFAPAVLSRILDFSRSRRSTKSSLQKRSRAPHAFHSVRPLVGGDGNDETVPTDFFLLRLRATFRRQRHSGYALYRASDALDELF